MPTLSGLKIRILTEEAGLDIPTFSNFYGIYYSLIFFNIFSNFIINS